MISSFLIFPLLVIQDKALHRFGSQVVGNHIRSPRVLCLSCNVWCPPGTNFGPPSLLIHNLPHGQLFAVALTSPVTQKTLNSITVKKTSPRHSLPQKPHYCSSLFKVIKTFSLLLFFLFLSYIFCFSSSNANYSAHSST